MTKNYFVFLFIMLSMMAFSQNEEHLVSLSSCRTFTFPATCLVEDGFYREYLRGDTTKTVRYEYEIKDGKLRGPLRVYDERGNLLARGSFARNELKNGLLWVYEGDQPEEIYLERDEPTWFLHRNWLRASGMHESSGGINFIWLAGQRYRLPEGISRLEF